MAPAQFENHGGSDKQVSQNSAIEAARPDIRDVDTAQVNEQLQGADAPMVNAFMDSLAKSDARDLPKLLAGDSDFSRFRQQLEDRVFAKDGKGGVSPSASTEDIARLQDVNNAMISALQGRRQAATKQLQGAETMSSFAS